MSEDAFKRQMEAFSADYRASLPARMAEVNALWALVGDGSQQPEACRELLRRLHTLAGSARTFGVPGVGQAARAAEAFLEPYCERGAMQTQAERAAFARLLDDLRRSAAD